MIDKVINEKTCMGCKMCGDLCPKAAISFKNGFDGFWYPSVDYDKCINCNLCVKRCPIVSEKVKFKRFDSPEVYAVWNRDEGLRLKSTSGGAFSALATSILDQGGVVVGCTYSDDYKAAFHMITDNIKNLQRLIGSKYFESDLAGIYNQVKLILKSGKDVLFAGSPCQVAALNNFIGEDHMSLYTCSYICRGINSPKAYRAYLQELERKYKSTIYKVHFKNKKQGWTNLGVNITFANGKEYYTNKINNSFLNGYNVGNLYLRQSCYSCHFKSMPFESDITYGDFWGGNFSQEDMKRGVSIVMINSAKGKKLFDMSTSRIFYEKHDILETQNGCLFASAPLNTDQRKDFFNRIDHEDFSKLVWEKLQTSESKQLLKFHIFNIKRNIRHLFGKNDYL